MRGIPVSRADFTASLVVFLVARPLCVGVAVASGVPAELGLITGIVGGLATGLLPGRSLQVSGPAAGLTVLVYEAVAHYGAAALGVLVLADATAPGSMGHQLAGLPGLVLGAGVTGSAVALGIGTVVVLVLWPKWRRAARVVPAPLVAVGLAAGATAL